MAEHKTSVDKENLTTTATSVFKAPLAKVWDACTNPEQLAKWWSPKGYTTDVQEHDFTEGGKWRNVQVAPDGNKYAFYGEFREIKPQEKTVSTFEFEQFAGHVIVETATYEAIDENTTRLTTVSKYENIGDLEGMLQSGMEQGQNESLEQLAQLVES